MDVANPAYQQAGLANVVSQVKAAGFDGVFLDDANASLRWVLPGGSAECVKYPTDAAWQSAAFSFLDHMAPQLQRAGLLVAANIGGSTITPGLWQKWNGPLDGAMEESFTNGGAGRDSIANGQWLAKLEPRPLVGDPREDRTRSRRDGQTQRRKIRPCDDAARRKRGEPLLRLDGLRDGACGGPSTGPRERSDGRSADTA